jgi:hypothetical protein
MTGRSAAGFGSAGQEPELLNRDFPAWSLLEQPGMVKRLADAACLTDAELPEDYRVTADLIEQRRHLKSRTRNCLSTTPSVLGGY